MSDNDRALLASTFCIEVPSSLILPGLPWLSHPRLGPVELGLKIVPTHPGIRFVFVLTEHRQCLSKQECVALRIIGVFLFPEDPNDPESDALLLREALAVLREYEDKPDAWMSW